MKNITDKCVAIVGCGWLGKIVGQDLIQEGITVFGSHRSESNKKTLESIGIIPFEFQDNQQFRIPLNLISKVDVVLLMLPPKAATENVAYDELLQTVCSQFHSETRFIFTSSTGIYPKIEGVLDESFPIDKIPDSPLKRAENTLLNLLGERLTILRLAGLIGPHRHPVYHFQDKEIGDNGETPVNLIHSRDISRAIQRIIENDAFGDCYNVVFPFHPRRVDYYPSIGRKLGVTGISFGKNTLNSTIIDGSKLESDFGFNYSFPIDNYSDFIR